MIVDMWMTSELHTIAPSATVAAAALAMGQRRVRRLLVVEPGPAKGQPPRLVGILTAGDVARAFPPDLNPAALVAEDAVPTTVASVMSPALHVTTPETPIEDAANLMRTHKIGALPVLRGDRLLGLITESDVFRAFVEMSGAGTPGLRVTFELRPDEDVVGTLREICRIHHAVMTSVIAFEHEDRRAGRPLRLGVVRLRTDEPDAVLDAIWKSAHRVVAVVRHPSGR